MESQASSLVKKLPVAWEVSDGLQEAAATLDFKSDPCPHGINLIALGDTIQLSNRILPDDRW